MTESRLRTGLRLWSATLIGERNRKHDCGMCVRCTKRFVVVVAADLALGHSSDPFLRLLPLDHARRQGIAICPYTCRRAMTWASTYAPLRSANRLWVPSTLNPNFSYSAIAGALSVYTRRSNLVRPNQLSARSTQASINRVPTPLPCQSSLTAIPKCPECRVLGFMWILSARWPTTSPCTQATIEKLSSRSLASSSRHASSEDYGTPSVSAIARGEE